MRIAIIGAGFAGLSIAWHFHSVGKHKITVFDKVGVGGGSSGIAAGLLHPYGGVRLRLNASGLEGMKATLALLDVASRHVNLPVVEKTGLYRIPISDQQLKEFQISAKLYGLPWQKYLGYDALYIPEAYTVNCPLYLQGLWEECHTLGSSLEITEVTSLSTLESTFDLIILSAGADSLFLRPDLSLKRLKGQILTIPNSYSITAPVTTQSYIIPQDDMLIVGATFERDFSSPLPDPDFAKENLLQPLESHFPGIMASPLLTCRAGVRATTPNYMPLIQQLSEKLWVASGLGSKGLLYHALLGDNLIDKVLRG